MPVFDPAKEQRILEAIRAYKNGSAPSLNEAARRHDVAPSTVKHRYNGRNTCGARQKQPTNQALTNGEEEVLVKWITQLWSQNFPARLDLVRHMAGKIAGREMGENWVTRFLQRHTELTTVRTRLLDDKRGKANDIEAVIGWFTIFYQMIKKHKILPENVWNMDEKGFLIGYGRTATVIVPTDNKHERFCLHDGNRDSVTMVECVSSVGKYCPPMVIFSGHVHLLEWHRDHVEREGWHWAISNKGFTNEHLAMEWLKHCFDPYTATIAGPKLSRSTRLLILDGHGSHITTDFIDYCCEARIVLLCLPPHSTHFLQPLDVGLFSHYSRAYGDTVNSFCERGGTGIGKRDFIDLISNARQKAFTDKTIIGGWKGSGLFPFDPLKVLESLPNFTKANHIQSLKVIIDNVEDNVPDTPTAQTPANPAALHQFVDTIYPHLDSPLKRKLDKVTKAASNLFTQITILETTNNSLLQDIKQQHRIHKPSSQSQLSKARVLADVELQALVDAAEQRAMQHVTRSQNRAQVPTTPARSRLQS
ncbi:hypothetical protein Dda_4745 [Drechslerella dactyloides]|uniref:HTH CENPB-type domain-containing protein n=1 Tax=Drechslerella dactyloides TaxID=74499 RepID=A0AAD6IXH4_DREDA|nr:hypothetical protein Dda_4745 [Drechslerella dactyloides]